MTIFEFLEKELSKSINTLNTMTRDFDKMDGKKHIEQSHEVFEEVTTYIKVQRNILYPALKDKPQGESKVAKSEENQDDIKDVMTKAKMIHVDEPSNEYRDHLENLLRLLQDEKTYITGTIFPFAKAELGEEELNKLSKQVEEQRAHESIPSPA